MRMFFLILMGFSMVFSQSVNLVYDKKSGLDWQDDYSDNEGTIQKTTWNEAIKYCENLTLGGFEDWRLPNIRELKSIADRSKSNPAIIDGFKNTVSGDYWSASSINVNREAWVVNFKYGDQNAWTNKAYSCYVRCVRDGQ